MRTACAFVLVAAACSRAPSTDASWQPSLQVGSDTSWKYAERASADFDGDGARETAVLIADVSLDARGHPLWEDGHHWRFYFEEPDGVRTYAYDAFVPNGRVDATIPAPQQAGDRPVVTLLVRAGALIALFEVSYGGPNRMRVRSVYDRPIDKHLSGTPRI
jgi:hypothetical protein